MIKSLYISYDSALGPLGQSQIIPYLKGLSLKEVRFTLVTFDKKDYSDERHKHTLYSELKKSNIKWLSLRYHKNPPGLSTTFDIIRGLFVCIIAAKIEEIKIVHARGYVPCFIALLLKKMIKIKFIFDMRAFWADAKVEIKHWNKNSIFYYCAKYFERKFIKNADRIVVLTKKAKQIIEDYGCTSSRISVIPCCVDVNMFRMDTKVRAELRKRNNLEGKFVFVHTGSFESGYMKDSMLDYFKSAKQIAPNVHFLIISQAPNNEILELIRKSQLKSDSFTIVSSAFNQMPRYLSMVDAAILFLSLGFKRGCSPTKFAEFLSCGIPIISSPKIGDTEESIINNKVGVIVNHFNDDEYKRSFLKLLKLLKDNNLKSRCRKLAEKELSLDTGIDRYHSIYTGLKNELHS